MSGPVAGAVSLFFPMFNEQSNIERAVSGALAALPAVSSVFEVVVVNDGSRDATGAIADRLAAADERVRVVHHARNRGYGAAVRSGFEAARYPMVVLADGDNQFDLGELPRLFSLIDDHDIVTGYRLRRRDPPIRRLNAMAYNMLVRMLFDVPVRDIDCGLKLYRKDLLSRLLPDLRSTGAVIGVEVLARARKMGARIAEAGVNHFPREAGTPTGGNPLVVLRAFRELPGIWRELR